MNEFTVRGRVKCPACKKMMTVEFRAFLSMRLTLAGPDESRWMIHATPGESWPEGHEVCRIAITQEQKDEWLREIRNP